MSNISICLDIFLYEFGHKLDTRVNESSRSETDSNPEKDEQATRLVRREQCEREFCEAERESYDSKTYPVIAIKHRQYTLFEGYCRTKLRMNERNHYG